MSFRTNQSWSIIVFCYNEVDTVNSVVNKAIDTLKKMKVDDWEIIIVDDGSTDGSVDVIKTIDLDQVRLVLHKKNKGIGHALRSGYTNSNKENVCAVPADGEFNLQELIPYSIVPENHFISFYRLENTTYSIFRNYLSKLNKIVNKRLNGFHLLDVNWVKIYKTEDIKKIDLTVTSSLVESEICGKLLLLGKEVIEVKSDYIPRTAGVSKGASFRIVKQAIGDMIKLSIVLKKFNRNQIK